MKEKNIVGENIKQLRTKIGFTQEELALNSGLSQGYINQLESGKRRFTQKSLEMIANALSVSIGDLFEKNEKSNDVSVVVEEKVEKYRKIRSSKKEFFALLDALPEHIVEHYLILLRLEKKIWSSKKT